MSFLISSIWSFYQLSLAQLCFIQTTCMLTMTSLIEHMKSVSRRTHAYLLSFLLVRAILSIWRFSHEAAAEVLLIVWPVTLAVSLQSPSVECQALIIKTVYFVVLRTKELVEKLSSEINGFRAGLQLETGSVWCSNVLYGKRNAPRDYQEDLDYRFCLQELDGISARPGLQKMKAQLISYLAMAILLLLLVFCSYALGRMHAWYKQSRATGAMRDIGTGMEHSTKAVVSRARLVHIRRVRHFLRPAHKQRSSTSNMTTRAVGQNQRNIQDSAAPGVDIPIGPSQAALSKSSAEAGLEQQVTTLKAQLENLNHQYSQVNTQAKALAYEKEHLQMSLRAAHSSAEEVASLKRRLAEQEAAQELQRSVLERQRKRFDEKHGVTTLARERLAEAGAKEARLNERVRKLEAQLELQAMEAQLEADGLRKSQVAEKEEFAVAQAQLSGLQAQMANISAMPAAVIQCDHEDHLRMVEKDAKEAVERIAAAAAEQKEQKEQEIAHLRQAAETEVRSLQTLLQTSRGEYEAERYRVSLLQADLCVADYSKSTLEGQMVDLQEAAKRTWAENAELRVQMARMAEELASTKAHCERLEESQSSGLNTAGGVPTSMHSGRADDAVVPFENLPSWQPRPLPTPQPTEAARIASRPRAPLPPRGSAEEQAANASSAPMLQELAWQHKPMSALDESHFADRMTKFVEVAMKSYQKWNSSTLSQADGAEKVAANFLDIIRNWEYVQPYMVARSRLEPVAKTIVNTEGKWPERLLQVQAPGFKARAKMVQYAREILDRIAAMPESDREERAANKRART